jgi:hypothetical protein
MLRKPFGSFIKSSSEDPSLGQKDDSDSDEHASGTSTPRSEDEANGASSNVQNRTGTVKKLPAGKAGGMRRKNLRRR